MTTNNLTADKAAPAAAIPPTEVGPRLALRRQEPTPFRCVVCKRARSSCRYGRWCVSCKSLVATFRLSWQRAGGAPHCPDTLVQERIETYRARAALELDLFADPSS